MKAKLLFGWFVIWAGLALGAETPTEAPAPEESLDAQLQRLAAEENRAPGVTSAEKLYAVFGMGSPTMNVSSGLSALNDATT